MSLNFFESDPSCLMPIPPIQLNDQEVLQELQEIVEEVSHKTIILGHHYQNDDVISFADVRGDSLALAQKAAQVEKPYIVFCGVHFMAETADILTSDAQQVILPDLNAGCSMADMANKEQIDKAWEFIKNSTKETVIPLTYINCDALLKSFVGENQGAICTSSNAEKMISWAFEKGQKLLFFPDQHLGRNTCFKMGIPLEEMVVYNPLHQNGGLTAEQIDKAKVILWYGYCSVHQGFKVEQIDHLRKTDSKRRIIVHPECSFEVVQAADEAGSTSYIVNQILKAPRGSTFAVGTEINLVNRLNREIPDKDIISLSPYQCLCTTMYRIRPRWLLDSFRKIREDDPINVIRVPEEVKHFSRIALNRMLELSL